MSLIQNDQTQITTAFIEQHRAAVDIEETDPDLGILR
jgi:hypothetical protein